MTELINLEDYLENRQVSLSTVSEYSLCYVLPYLILLPEKCVFNAWQNKLVIKRFHEVPH